MTEEEEVEMPEGWKEFDIAEAREELNEEQLRKWDDYRSEKMREQGRENIEELQEEESEAVEALLEEADDTMTSEVEIQGHTFEVDLSLLQDQRGELKKKFDDIEDMDTDDVDSETLERIEEDLIEALDKMVVNTSESVWRKFSEERNVATLNVVGGKILMKAQADLQNKMGSVEKFQST